MNDIIHDTLATDNALMNEVVTSYLKTKGKQIRPIMVMLAAKMFGEVNERVALCRRGPRDAAQRFADT